MSEGTHQGRLRACIERAFDAIGRAASQPIPSASEPIVIAFSGGLDSTVLLDTCVRLLGPQGLIAAYVHHGLQADAEQWVSHCEQQARARGVRFECLRLGPAQPAGIGLEAWARAARYKALWALVQALNARVLMTAHQADDRAETILLRLARGTGLEGLAAALPAYSQRSGGRWLIRPFLDIRRTELLEHAHSCGLHWVEDSMNRHLAFQRVRVREQLMPALEQVAPGASRQLARAQELLADAASELQSLAVADLAMSRIETGPDEPQAIDRRSLAGLSRYRQAQLARQWWRELWDDPLAAMPTQAQVCEWLSQMVDSVAAQAVIHWSAWVFVRYRDRIEAWAAHSAPAAALLPSGRRPPVSYEVHWRGEVELDLEPWSARLRFVAAEGRRLRPSAQGTAVLRVLQPPSEWRARLMAGRHSKPLRKLWQESGVAPALRPWLPLLVIDGEPMHIAGLGPLQVGRQAQTALGAGGGVVFEPLLSSDPRRRFCQPHRL